MKFQPFRYSFDESKDREGANYGISESESRATKRNAGTRILQDENETGPSGVCRECDKFQKLPGRPEVYWSQDSVIVSSTGYNGSCPPDSSVYRASFQHITGFLRN